MEKKSTAMTASWREIGTHSWDDIRHIDDLGKKFCKELEEFFVNYHDLMAQGVSNSGD